MMTIFHSRPMVKLVCDLQFGSTGKGLLSGYIGEMWRPDTVVTAWTPNSGHTYIDSKGEKQIHTMIGNGTVSPSLRKIMLGPGSVINLPRLHSELLGVNAYKRGVQVFIHHAACILQDRHSDLESRSLVSIGSTMKGSGAALIEKIGRSSGRITAGEWIHDRRDEFMQYTVVNSQNGWLNILGQSERILVEGSQGYSLGINSGFYPYTTSRECTPQAIMSDCGIPAIWRAEKIGVCRTYPIRVANRFNEKGDMIGYSGPCYKDQQEIDWSDLGLVPELTTVTKLPRRIFTFSAEQVVEACFMGGIDSVMLNFVNYPSTTGHKLAFDTLGSLIKYLGYGPRFVDVKECGEYTWRAVK